MTMLDPTAGLTDFDAVTNLREGWSAMLSDLIDAMNYGPLPPRSGPTVLEELSKWGYSDSDIRFYNPLSMPTPANSSDANVPWFALPTSFDALYPNKSKRYAFLDVQHYDSRARVMSRVQDEYNEWVVIRDAQNNIKRVIFTSEPIAYYDFMANPPTNVDKVASRKLLTDLYSAACDNQNVPLADLLDAGGNYDAYNKWNAAYAVHMQQANNSLGAEVNIAARSAILRKATKTGTLKTDAQSLIKCASYGQAERQSDPSIGAAVNKAVRQNQFITLQNPIGLYMTGLDTTGWQSPDGTDPQTFWKVIRGTASADPGSSRIARAIYEVPADKGYSVSNIKIGGASIEFGSQIAAHIGMRLGVTVSPPSNLPMPRAIGCVDEQPSPAPAPRSMAHGLVAR